MAVSKGLKKWRGKQKRGAIMKPSTFSKIEANAKGKGGKKLSKESREKIAGAAYWKTAKAKFKKSKAKKSGKKSSRK